MEEKLYLSILNDSENQDLNDRLNGECVAIMNISKDILTLNNHFLTDYQPNQEKFHKYDFENISLFPNDIIFVYTGEGEDRKTLIEHKGKMIFVHSLYQNRKWFVWNNSGDIAKIYDSDNLYRPIAKSKLN